MNGELTLMPALPEITLLVVLCAVLLIDLFVSDKSRIITYVLSIVGVAITAAVQVFIWTGEPETAFHGMFVNDGMSQLAKLVMYAVTILVFTYSRHYLKNRDIFQGEFFTLTLFALLGMNIMVSATHFVTLYIGLELLSLALYALVAFRRQDTRASEAGLKYFVLGALASGLFLYGVSFIYGATGTLYIGEIATKMQNPEYQWLSLLGLIFVVVGLAFKFGAVPFHMWVPDVYEGAPTAVSTLVGSAPKVATVVFAFRILEGGLATMSINWSLMFILLGCASLLVGNLSAIKQTNVKRMLGYSTVSHMGFILLAFAASSAAGVQAAMYYGIVYALMSLVAFGVLMTLSTREKECETLDDLAGLNQRSPWLALVMLLAMFSMAGIPPLMGFYAKLSVLQALVSTAMVAEGSLYGVYVSVSVFAVIMSLIGAFYYLRVVKVMYFDNAQEGATSKWQLGLEGKVLLSINALMLLVWGMMPEAVASWCVEAVKTAWTGL